MEDIHVAAILENKQKIMDRFSFTDLSYKMLESKILTETMVNNIEKKFTEEDDRMSALIDKLTLRGPRDFERFYNIILSFSK